MGKAFRWEQRCLCDDPFAGDFGDGERVLSDKMVTARKGGTCHACGQATQPGERNRVRVEAYGSELLRFRWCEKCCFGQAVYDIRPSILDKRIEGRRP